MKKIIALLTALVILCLCLPGCSKAESAEIILPPERLGSKGTFDASLDCPDDLDDIIRGADVIAVIEIGSWLSEDNDVQKTYYEAKVKTSYKGLPADDIVILQDGDSRFTMRNYPLFTSGNQMLLFLKKASGKDYKNAYWIEGAFTTLFDVAYVDDEMYFADRYGILGYRINSIRNYANDKEIKQSVINYLEQKDPFIKDLGYGYSYIFNAKEFAGII